MWRELKVDDDQTGTPTDATPPAGAPPDAPRQNVDERLARMTTRGAFLGFQMGATLVASICGVLFFLLLLGWQINNVIAAAGGLVFALVARRAFTWLLLYWLTMRAARGGPPA
jgi:hypothetical protein